MSASTAAREALATATATRRAAAARRVAHHTAVAASLAAAVCSCGAPEDAPEATHAYYDDLA